MSEELMTVKEAAKILKVHPATIRRYIKNGHLKAATLPYGDYRLREKDIQKLLKPSSSSEEAFFLRGVFPFTISKGLT